MLATVRCGPVKNRHRRVGEGAYMGDLRFGQRLFAILFRNCAKIAEFRRFAMPRTTWKWALRGEIQDPVNDSSPQKCAIQP